MKAINALYLEVDKSIADSIKDIVLDVIKEQDDLAKERAVEFNMRGITRFENDGMEELYNKAYDTFFAEKRKEGAE